MIDVNLVPWPLEAPPTESLILEIIRKEGLEAYRWSNMPGENYPSHKHNFFKVIYVVRGSIEFGLPATGESIHLKPGDRLELMSGVVHNARVGPQGVACLEAHRG